MLSFLQKPWPWYVAGPIIGLMVPALLLLGNKSFGISSNLRHLCAIGFPGRVPFFQYNWKKEAWNLFFAGGILLGGWIAGRFLMSTQPIELNPNLVASLQQHGIKPQAALVPQEIFSWAHLFSVRSLTMMLGGGFLVGFGTRYAGGCTSGHSIMGLATLQWPSLVATVCFMIGGIVMANLLLPYILNL
jgi:uncharacterized protein